MNNVRTLELKNFSFDNIIVRHYPLDKTITIKQVLDGEPMTVALSIYDIWVIHTFILNYK